MGPVVCPEMLVINYQFTLDNIPEERRPHLHCKGSRNHKTYMLHITDWT